MKASLGLLAAGILAVAVLVVTTVGVPVHRPAPAPTPVAAAGATPGATPGSVSANGITLASTSITLPADEGTYPAGPHADLVNANCTGCHSASMALNQPKLTADQWKAEVTKMREVYKAPVAAADMPAIVAYLTTLPGQQQQAPDPTATAKQPG